MVAKQTAAKRIEKAKKAYGLAEEKTDSVFSTMIDSPFTLVLVIAAFFLAFTSGYLIGMC